MFLFLDKTCIEINWLDIKSLFFSSLKMSDDEGREGDFLRPDTRTVSTSPDPTLEEEDERVCPMCNAVFPRVIPQESFESHVVSHFEVENGFEVIA